MKQVSFRIPFLNVNVEGFNWLIAFALFLAFSTVQAASTRAKVSRASFDFGLVGQRALCTHNFWVKNSGISSIRISKIEAGCSCTQIPLPDSSIRPGDSVPLGISFSSGSFRGIVVKSPKFWVDDDTAAYQLKIYANVMTDSMMYRPVRPTPANVDISQFGTKERRKATVTLTNLTNLPYKITVTDSTGKSATVSVAKSIAPKGTVELTLTIKPSAATTDLRESITIFLDDSDKTSITIPYTRLYRPNSAPATGSR